MELDSQKIQNMALWQAIGLIPLPIAFLHRIRDAKDAYLCLAMK